MSDDYGYANLSDEERAAELEDLRQRAEALATRPTAPAPAPPAPRGANDTDWVAAVNAATSAQEVEALLAKRAALSEPAAGAGFDPWAEVRGETRTATWSRPTVDAEPPRTGDYATDIAKANTPGEVMAALRAAGVPMADEVSW